MLGKSVKTPIGEAKEGHAWSIIGNTPCHGWLYIGTSLSSKACSWLGGKHFAYTTSGKLVLVLRLGYCLLPTYLYL